MYWSKYSFKLRFVVALIQEGKQDFILINCNTTYWFLQWPLSGYSLHCWIVVKKQILLSHYLLTIWLRHIIFPASYSTIYRYIYIVYDDIIFFIIWCKGSFNFCSFQKWKQEIHQIYNFNQTENINYKCYPPTVSTND